MGQEVPCSVRCDDKERRGKALLESSEIVVRGDLRLTIPLANLTSVSSRDGELHLKWKDGAAVLQLGKHADKWAHKILNPKSTLQKLGVKPGLVISALGLNDSHFVRDLRENAARFSSTKAVQASDLIFWGAEKLAALATLQDAVTNLGDAGALWIVYPKGRQDIKEQNVLDAGRGAGLTDVKVVSFSPTHTALKFVRPKAKRPSRPKT